MKFRVREVSVFVVEADTEEDAEAIVREGISHSRELIEASHQFYISERDVGPEP